MSEQDINAPFYQFCLTGEGDIAALQASIFQREGGCHELHDFIFNNKELPALREHFLAQFKRRVNTNSLLRRFMEQFANELGFDNFSDYFDAQQARFPSQSLVYSFTLGLGTDQEHAGIGKRIRNANRPVLRQPSNATAATLGAPAPNANNTNSWRSVFSTPVQTHPSGSVSGTPFGSFGMQPNINSSRLFHTPGQKHPNNTNGLSTGLFSAHKENVVNGPTSSFHSGNSQASWGDVSSFAGLSIGGNSSAAPKKDERALLEQMHLGDIHNIMLDQNKFNNYLNIGLTSQNQLSGMTIKVLNSKEHTGYISYKRLCEEQEDIYDKEESGLDSRIDENDGRLVTVETEHEERMRLIQEEGDEEIRKVKAKLNETIRRVELEQAKTKRELEAEKDGFQRDKARTKEEKENNLTLPKANLLTIKTAYDLVQLYHLKHVEQDGNPDLQTKINTNLSILQHLQNGIAKKSLDELKLLVWDDDDL